MTWEIKSLEEVSHSSSDKWNEYFVTWTYKEQTKEDRVYAMDELEVLTLATIGLTKQPWREYTKRERQ